MTLSQPLEWLRYIEEEVLRCEEKPQFILPKPFDWKQFEGFLRDIFDVEGLSLSHTTAGWITRGAIDLQEPSVVGIEWAPLKTPAYFMMQKQDLQQLIGELFKTDARTTYFYEKSILEGFYYFFAAGIMSLLNELAFAAPLAPRLLETVDSVDTIFNDAPCFAIDVNLDLNGKVVWGKILIPAELRRECTRYFQSIPRPPLSDEMRQKVHVDLSLVIGEVSLLPEAYSDLEEGDFLVLDRCYYDPDERQGVTLITLNQKMLFRGRFKRDEGIKLTHYPHYEEVSMSQSHFDSDDEDEDEFLDEEETEDEDLEEEEAPAKEEKIDVEKLPIDITVEVCRVRMSVEELAALQPGNLIDLPVTPEQGVDLVIKGRKIAKGELLRVGDVLGVRILSL